MTGKTKHTVSGIVSLKLAVLLWAPAHSITTTKPDKVDWRATTTKGSDQVKKKGRKPPTSYGLAEKDGGL